MKFTIKRSKWLRGEGVSKSRLLRKGDGKQCCIGQICLQLGVPDKAITDITDVNNILIEHSPKLEKVLTPLLLLSDKQEGYRHAAGWVGSAYCINDAQDVPDDATREKHLAELAAANGHELVFVD